MQQSFSNNGSLIRVAIVAKSALVRAGLESILLTNLETFHETRTAEMEGLCGEATSDITSLSLQNSNLKLVGSISKFDLQQLDRLQPEVVILFWEDEDEELLASSDNPDTNWQNFYPIALLDDWQPESLAKMLRAGVRGILPSVASIEEIVSAIATVALGLIVIHPDLIDSLSLARDKQPILSVSSIQALTSREIEVLEMLAEGLGNKQIARRLGISEHTVKFHISSIFSKLDASSRTEAVILGARQGLILL
jgi:DNA-binding NarL/FixJ family response regulator